MRPSSTWSSRRRWLRSAWAWRTQQRSVSRLMPSSSAMWAIGRPLDKTSSTARSRSSGGYWRGAGMVLLPSAGSIEPGFRASGKAGEPQDGGVAFGSLGVVADDEPLVVADLDFLDAQVVGDLG